MAKYFLKRHTEPQKEVVAKIVDELLKRDNIFPSTSEQASPVVTIKKLIGSDRLCINYRQFNAFITTDGLFEYKRLPFGLKNARAAFI